MRKFLLAILFAFIFVTTLICGFSFNDDLVAKANSGPPYIPSGGGIGGLSFEQNDTIKVINEDLIFEIDKRYDSQIYSDNKATQVTAKYEMENLSDTAQNIKMAFPYYTSWIRSEFYSLRKDDCVYVKDGETVLPYTLRILGSITESDPTDYTQEDINNILYGISEAKQMAYDSDLEYSLVKLTGDTVTFKADAYKGFLYIGNLERTSYYTYGEKLYMGMRKINNDKDIFLIAESDFVSSIILKSGEIASVDVVDDINALCLDLVKEAYTDAESLEYLEQSHPQLLTDLRDQTFFYNENKPVYDEYLVARAFDSLILVILYEVNFLPKEIKNLEVTYLMLPNQKNDKVSYSDHYIYFLSPASNWASFEKINIIIDVSSARRYYMVDSSLDFTYNETDRKYVYSADFLPENELYFVMRENESSQNLDAYDSAILPNLSPYEKIGVAIIVIVVVVIAFVIIIIAAFANRY